MTMQALLALAGQALAVDVAGQPVLSPPCGWVYLALPWLAAWAGSQPVDDGKRVHRWALAQLRYLLLEPRLLARLRPLREPRQGRLRATVWQPLRPADDDVRLGELGALGDLHVELRGVNGRARRAG